VKTHCCRHSLVICVVLLLGGSGILKGKDRPGPSPQKYDLMVYYSWDDEVARVLLDAFAKESGTKVNGMRRSTRHLVKVIEAEMESPVATVILGGPAPSYQLLKQAGLLHAYRAIGSEDIPVRFRDPDGMWTGIYLGVIGFGTDIRQTRRVPRSWEELLHMDLPRGVAYANRSKLISLFLYS